MFICIHMYCPYYIICIIKHKDQNLKGTKLKQILMKLFPTTYCTRAQHGKPRSLTLLSFKYHS